MAKKLYCPVCKKPLSEKEHEKALGILHARVDDELSALKKKLSEAKQSAKEAKTAGINLERSRTQRLVAGKDKQIKQLLERMRQLKKGTTPQTEGLEDEDKLRARLKKEFPEDRIQSTGSRGGDVLQYVMSDKKEAGVIIYECKRTPRIPNEHIQQACSAKESRQADFCVLVTTGSKRGFNGLAQTNGVLIVSPLGVIPLASLLRSFLIEMIRSQISKQKRAVVAQNLLQFITSPQFKNPIEGVINTSAELSEMIKEEFKDHMRVWEKRNKHYQKIKWDSTQIQDNLRLILLGKDPNPILQLKPAPLQLPLTHR